MQSLLYDIYSTLFIPRYRYGDAQNQLRARATLTLSTVIAAVLLLTVVGLASAGQRSDQVNNALTISLAFMFVQLLIIGLIHAGQLRMAMVVMFTLLGISVAASTVLSGVQSSLLLATASLMIYSSLVLSPFGVLTVGFLEAILVVVTGTLQTQGHLPVGTPGRDQIPIYTILALVNLSIFATLSALVALEARRTTRHSGRLMTQLRATGEIAQIAATVSGPTELLARTVSYIRDRFGVYHVQAFLVDAERRYANLIASTGEAGELLMQRGYRLAVGSQSAIGSALLTGESVTLLAGENQTDFVARRNNELLPDTRSELVLPMIVGDVVIGALDVQSTRGNAFNAEMVENLQILAAQVAAATHSARTLDETRLALNDARRLYLETEVNLREAQRLNQRLTGEAWEDYLKSRSAQIVGYTLSENRLQRDATWTPALQQAAGNRRAIISANDGNRQVVAVPIELRGRSIGAIEIELEGTIRQAETLEVLQSLAQRLALSIDNARLFEQAQELAQRELEVNAISTNLQGINDVDELARMTLQELSRALGATQASIRLGALSVRQEQHSEQRQDQPALNPAART